MQFNQKFDCEFGGSEIKFKFKFKAKVEVEVEVKVEKKFL
jgi:hypothetical protein